MSVINLFDPVSKIWYKQAASGSIPSSRLWFCTAGVGDNRPVTGSNSTGTYEMYVLSDKAVPVLKRKWYRIPGELQEDDSSPAAPCSTLHVDNKLSLLLNQACFSRDKK